MNELISTLDQRLSEITPVEKRWHCTMDDIAARIIDLMELQGLTQDALATRMGKHKSYISRVLSGTVNLTLKTIAEFEAAFDASIIQIVPAEPGEMPLRRSNSKKMGADAVDPSNVEGKYTVNLSE